MRKINLGGIKVLAELNALTLSDAGGEDVLASICARLAGNRTNMVFLTYHYDKNNSQSVTTFCTLGGSDSLVRKSVEAINTPALRVNEISDVGLLSIFPHDQKPQAAGALLHLLANHDVPLFGFGSSPSSLSVLIKAKHVPAMVANINEQFELPSYRSPYDWYAAYHGREQVLKDVVASYQEKIIKTFYIVSEKDLTFWLILFPEKQLPAFADALKTLGSQGIKMPFMTVHQYPDSSLAFSICFYQKGHASASEVLRSHLSDFAVIGDDAAEAIFMHGPHFVDRYGIADALVGCLQEAAVIPLALSCTLSSISLVVESQDRDKAKRALQLRFETPMSR